MDVKLPYGKTYVTLHGSEKEVFHMLEGGMKDYVPDKGQMELVRDALEKPINSERLSFLAKGKKKVVVIASDHTRPVPSKIMMPLLLEEIRRQNPMVDITILIATGCHREMTAQELENKFGKEIVDKEKIIVHDCDNEDQLVKLGKLPSGGDCIINKLAYEADLLIAEGFIEPHFFAGYSGGRKSVLPGVASRKTVMYNHNAAFINHKNARTGILEKNPIHEDMIYAAKKAKLAFICNVVLNEKKEIIYAVAGDVDAAHLHGVSFIEKLCKVFGEKADIVITTNGGYPLDQNVYQAVKGMTAAEAFCRENGVIIMIAKAEDGIGGEYFYRMFAEEKNLEKLMSRFLDTPAEKTVPDQWQAQILARILLKHRVILVSEMDESLIRDMHMIPARTIDEARVLAKHMVLNQGTKDPEILVIPDGVSIIP